MNGRSQTQENPGNRDQATEQRPEDVVDPRVQIELERLNTATDEINKLEVDLDDARATFRELLCESTIKIDNLAKKLGSCIEKSRPYYDARFRAKEALSEAQKAASKFERANSQLAAAKEMVYLAEDGLKTEGRCFDHAFQEMLNHATSRVNESEHERAICEAEHRRTTAFYHKAEFEVQRLQRDLKRSIAKSRPYYETKAHFNQVLENQKKRVGALEKSVSDAKATYAQALRNLEKISDEIHRTRRYDGTNHINKNSIEKNYVNTRNSTDSSSLTGSPDSCVADYSDESLSPPEKLSTDNSTSSKTNNDKPPVYVSINLSSSEPRKYITKRERPRSIASSDTAYIIHKNTHNHISPPDVLSLPKSHRKPPKPPRNLSKSPSNGQRQNGEEWSEISLGNSPRSENEGLGLSPSEQVDLVKTGHLNSTHVRRKKFITQKSLPAEGSEKEECTSSPSVKRKGKLDSYSLANWISRNSVMGDVSTTSSENSSRRQSFDILWNTGTGERVKDLLNQGMMMLNISNLTDKRQNETKVEKEVPEKLEPQEFKGRKAPSPLEKTLSYLNVEDEGSDCESLTSCEMLSEDQISSLMMEPDMNQVCQEVLGTPLVEVCPILHQLQQGQQKQ